MQLNPELCGVLNKKKKSYYWQLWYNFQPLNKQYRQDVTVKECENCPSWYKNHLKTLLFLLRTLKICPNMHIVPSSKHNIELFYMLVQKELFEIHFLFS